jgi:hypothetical protein
MHYVKKSKIYSLMNRHIYIRPMFIGEPINIRTTMALVGCQGGLIMFVGENVICLCSSVSHHQ